MLLTFINRNKTMNNLTAKEKKKLDRDAQTFKCLYCDTKDAVKWNGDQWQCGNSNRLYGRKAEITL